MVAFLALLGLPVIVLNLVTLPVGHSTGTVSLLVGLSSVGALIGSRGLARRGQTGRACLVLLPCVVLGLPALGAVVLTVVVLMSERH